ncbi:MAG TPA: manganese/iron ABC transporter ATP-binding protein, partial [Bosea sp. (in: a-proteobacteria)]
LMLVSTHNLGSIPDFCDQVVIVNKTVLAAGPTETAFTHDNLQRAFGGALRHFRLGGAELHDDADERRVTVITDDERPLVLYGKQDSEMLAGGKANGDAAESEKADSTKDSAP